MATCVVCNKPIVNPVPMKDGTIRHKNCQYGNPADYVGERHRQKKPEKDCKPPWSPGGAHH